MPTPWPSTLRICFATSCCHLQGIALSANKDYKVLGAAYPWIARRLLTERSVELQDTLRTLLYNRGRFQVGSVCKTGRSSCRLASAACPGTGTAASAEWHALQFRTLAGLGSLWMSPALRCTSQQSRSQV